MAPLGTCVDLAVTVPTLFAHTIRPRLPKFLCNFCQAPCRWDRDLCKRKSEKIAVCSREHVASRHHGLDQKAADDHRFSFARRKRGSA